MPKLFLEILKRPGGSPREAGSAVWQRMSRQGAVGRRVLAYPQHLASAAATGGPRGKPMVGGRKPEGRPERGGWGGQPQRLRSPCRVSQVDDWPLVLSSGACSSPLKVGRGGGAPVKKVPISRAPLPPGVPGSAACM